MIRLRLVCRGAVQGVGFRPAVHRLATAAGLRGWVSNDPIGATLEVEGEREAIEAFIERLRSELPPLARLETMERELVEPMGESGFEVRTSTLGRRQGALVPPDAVLCADCRKEMDDPGDRRYHYPFTTCTNCGPRFSLVHELPYDRERTSMACFPLCDDCRSEYEDPTDRRFHAEPIACPSCGPRLWLVDGEGQTIATADAAVKEARRKILAGAVVAVKGLGGFQLACRADSEEAVERLRHRKRRLGKPFAVMVRDLEVLRTLVDPDHETESLLSSPKSPIALAPRRRPSAIAEAVAPGLEDIGVMLPTTPLHVELLRDATLPPLVMTSGNLSEEPLCRSNRAAVAGLRDIADFFLLHDRDVVRRIDDSVVRSTVRGPMMVRRARGWVPEPLALPVEAPAVIVAAGGHLQVTTCIGHGGQAFLSQHVGDLDTTAARQFHQEVIEGLLEFLQVEPELVACDQHPDYPSSWLARQLAERSGAELIPVQHHLAHAAAVLAEHGRFPEAGERRLGVSLDGTGWGPDGTAWGGEWIEFEGDLSWSRLAHLQQIPLVGGEAAVREPWRVAVAALVRAGREELLAATPLGAAVEPDRLQQMIRLVRDGTWPLASGAGRIFEAAGALLGAGTVNRYEGESAARCEALAATAWGNAGPWPGIEIASGDSGPVLPSARLLAEVADRVAGGEDPAAVAAGFHASFCQLAAELTIRVSGGGQGIVALGGGCLVNRLLGVGLAEALERAGYEALLPRQVPPGDGGLSYGQAVVAAVAAKRGAPPTLSGPK